MTKQYKQLKCICVFIFCIVLPSLCNADVVSTEFVVLLHGLAHSKRTMAKLGHSLSEAGYGVLNLGYPSRVLTIEEISERYVPKAIDICRQNNAKKIHFVTHSMGGIIVRYYLKHHYVPELGRVVMLSPPNKGSEVVDKLKNNFLFKWLNGPAGQQLGTDSNSLPKQIGNVNFDLGVITGDRSINLLLSIIIPGPDDGKVSIENARIEGMKDFIIIHSAHPFIMKNKRAIMQTIAFIKNGKFTRKSNT